MHLLPIVDRELRVAARRPKTYRSRWIAALTALACTGYFFWLFAHVPGMSGAGRQVFATLIQFTFIYCLFVGAGTTADCLSSEKREGTIGFLFLTKLCAWDIVLGKLAATSLLAFYGIVATVPVLGICLVAGGVQAGEFWRMVLALLNTLFFSLSIGLLVSSLSREERRATQTASGLMVFFGFGLPVLGEYLQAKTSAMELGSFLKTLSPSQTLGFSTRPITSMNYFWWSVLAVHLLAWLALGSTCCLLPKAWQDAPAPQRPASRRERWREWSLGHPARRRIHRQRLNRNPVYWLATRARLLELETWAVLGTVVLVAVWSGWWFRATVSWFIICVITAVILHTVIKLQFCAAACERFTEDQHNGTLEVLLATPLSVPEILRGQWLALIRQFAGPIGMVILTDTLMLLLVLNVREQDVFDNPNAVTNCLWFFAAGIGSLLIDAIALGWMGMWQALAAKQVTQARSRALFFILIVPWTLLILVVSLIAMAQPSGLRFLHLLAFWFLFGTLNSVGFGLWARRRLRIHFRLAATQRFQPGKLAWLWWVPNRPSI